MKKHPANEILNIGAELLQPGAHSKHSAITNVDPLGVIERFTFADVAREAVRWAALVRRHELQPGERVVVLAGPAWEWRCALLGVLYAGGVAVPCPDSASVEELQAITADSGAKLLVSVRERPDLVAREEPRALTGQHLETVDERVARSQPPHPTSPNDGALILYTGTAGGLRGAVHTHASLAAQANSGEHWLGVSEDERVWCTATDGSAESIWLLLAAGRAHANVVNLNLELDAVGQLELLHRIRPSAVWLSDEEYGVLGSADVPGWIDLGSIRRALSNDEPFAGVTAFAEVVGAAVTPLIGLNEIGVVAGCPTGEEGHAVEKTAIPVPGIPLAIVDGQGKQLPADHVGDVVVRGDAPSLCGGYTSGETKRRDGWFHLHFRAALGADNSLRLDSRPRLDTELTEAEVEMSGAELADEVAIEQIADAAEPSTAQSKREAKRAQRREEREAKEQRRAEERRNREEEKSRKLAERAEAKERKKAERAEGEKRRERERLAKERQQAEAAERASREAAEAEARRQADEEAARAEEQRREEEEKKRAKAEAEERARHEAAEAEERRRADEAAQAEEQRREEEAKLREQERLREDEEGRRREEQLAKERAKAEAEERARREAAEAEERQRTEERREEEERQREREAEERRRSEEAARAEEQRRETEAKQHEKERLRQEEEARRREEQLAKEREKAQAEDRARREAAEAEERRRTEEAARAEEQRREKEAKQREKERLRQEEEARRREEQLAKERAKAEAKERAQREAAEAEERRQAEEAARAEERRREEEEKQLERERRREEREARRREEQLAKERAKAEAEERAQREAAEAEERRRTEEATRAEKLRREKEEKEREQERRREEKEARRREERQAKEAARAERKTARLGRRRRSKDSEPRVNGEREKDFQPEAEPEHVTADILSRISLYGMNASPTGPDEGTEAEAPTNSGSPSEPTEEENVQ
jgi:AMP-binding enzyme